jgi:hypothetical protein
MPAPDRAHNRNILRSQADEFRVYPRRWPRPFATAWSATSIAGSPGGRERSYVFCAGAARVTCNTGGGGDPRVWHRFETTGALNSTEPGYGNKDCARSRSGSLTTGPQGSPRRLTARRMPLPPANAPTTTRRSWTRSRSGPTSETRRDLDCHRRRRLHRQASTSGDRPRRPLRHRSCHHLPLHHRPDRGAAVPAVYPGVTWQRPVLATLQAPSLAGQGPTAAVRAELSKAGGHLA